MSLQPQIRKRARVVVCKRITLQLGHEALVVPDLEMIHLTEYVDFADHRRRLTKPRRNDDTALAVNFRKLTEEIDPVQEFQTGWMRRGNLREPSFELGPDRHRVDPDRVTVQTGDEQFAPMLILDERAEAVGDFESPPVVNFRRRVAPKHARLLHFSPQKSIAS